MKRNKFFKAFGFGSLALLIGIAGTFSFAPLGPCAQDNTLASASTIDEINTRADGENIKYAPSPLGLAPETDPVIYTTESGLDIKYGGASISDQLASGKPLSGYPYFTMGTYSGYAVNWIIIGRNTNDTVFTNAISSHLFSTWKTNNNAPSATFVPKAKYWFNGGGYETITPAGNAINVDTSSKGYVEDIKKVTKSVVGNTEVPQGTVLAISEYTLGQCVFHPSRDISIVATNYETSTLKTNINNLYNSGLSFTTAQKNMIVAQNLTNAYTNKNVADTSSYNCYNSTSSSQKLFSLASRSNTTLTELKNINFCIDTYLTTNALRIAYKFNTSTKIRYWTRGGDRHIYDPHFIKLDGSISLGGTVQTGDTSYVAGDPTASNGYNVDTDSDDIMAIRPVCVIKFA